MREIKRVSIFTDGSQAPGTDSGGTGVVIVENDKTLFSQSLRADETISVAHIELWGVVYGIKAFLKSVIGNKVKDFYVVSFYIDNTEVYQAISSRSANGDMKELKQGNAFKNTLNTLFQLMEDVRFKVDFYLINGDEKKKYLAHKFADQLSKAMTARIKKEHNKKQAKLAIVAKANKTKKAKELSEEEKAKRKVQSEMDKAKYQVELARRKAQSEQDKAKNQAKLAKK